MILSTREPSNDPVITNSLGKEDRDFNFDLTERTEVFRSCGLTWRGESYVFGGESENRQISKIVGCSLERIGSLDNDFINATCTNVNDEDLYLCFNESPCFGVFDFK